MPNVERHVGDVVQECLVESDAAVLHAERIEAVLISPPGPFGTIYPGRFGFRNCHDRVSFTAGFPLRLRR